MYPSNLPPVHLLEAEAVHCLQVKVDHHEEVGLGASAGHGLDVVQGVHRKLCHLCVRFIFLRTLLLNSREAEKYFLHLFVNVS